MDRHLSENTFQNYLRKSSENFREVLYALIVGLLVGLVGAFFRIVLKYIESFRNLLYVDANSQWGESWNWIWPILFAVVSIWIALFLVRKFAPETSGSGVHEIEGALDASLTTSFLSNEPIYSTLLTRTLKKFAAKNVKEENSSSHNFREKQYKRRYSEKRK